MELRKMRTFIQNKMWRDKAIDMMEQQHGSKIHYRVLDAAEYDEQLRLKMLEEVHEVIAARSKKELTGEIADILEIIDALCIAHDITKDEISSEKIAKYNQRGGFTSRKFVTKAEHPEGSFGEKYCLADPLKYPEVT